MVLKTVFKKKKFIMVFSLYTFNFCLKCLVLGIAEG